MVFWVMDSAWLSAGSWLRRSRDFLCCSNMMNARFYKINFLSSVISAMFALIAACVSNSNATELMLRDGTVITETAFIEQTAEGDFLFETPAGACAFAARDWIRWGQWQDRKDRPQLILTDGSRLSVFVQAMTRDDLWLESDVWPPQKLTRSYLRTLCFQPPERMLEVDRLLDQPPSESDLSSDRLLTTQGDRLLGQLQSAPAGESPEQPMPGTAGIQQVWWQRASGQPAKPIPVSEIVAIWWSMPPRFARQNTSPAGLLVGLRDGSLLVVQELQQVDKQIRLRLACGAELTTEAELFWSATCFLQPADQGVRYLSDGAPLAFRQVPFFALSRPLGRDRNALGGRLRGGPATYPKGLGMHGTARAVYALQADEEQFAAEVGIDATTGSEGSVIFRVFVERSAEDGSSSWQLAAQTPVLRAGDPLVPLRLDVRQAKRIALVTDFTDRADLGDVANWFNARVLSTMQP